MTLQMVMMVMAVQGARAHFRCSFTAILAFSLLFYSYSALLLCCLACSAAFVDFYCLSGLLLPLSTFTAFVDCC